MDHVSHNMVRVYEGRKLLEAVIEDEGEKLIRLLIKKKSCKEKKLKEEKKIKGKERS